MEKIKLWLKIGIFVITVVYIWFIYNGLWNLAFYTDFDIIGAFHIETVFDYHRLMITPTTGIISILGVSSIMVMAWLYTHKIKGRTLDIIGVIVITLLLNLLVAFAIRNMLIEYYRPALPNVSTYFLFFKNRCVWNNIINATILNLFCYFMLYKILNSGEDNDFDLNIDEKESLINE